MPTAEIANTARLSEEEVAYSHPEGIQIPNDEEIMAEIERRYEEQQSGKSRGLTWEEYQLFDQLAGEFPHLSDQEIMEEIDRRYEEQQRKKNQGLTVQREYELAM